MQRFGCYQRGHAIGYANFKWCLRGNAGFDHFSETGQTAQQVAGLGQGALPGRGGAQGFDCAVKKGAAGAGFKALKEKEKGEMEEQRAGLEARLAALEEML